MFYSKFFLNTFHPPPKHTCFGQNSADSNHFHYWGWTFRPFYLLYAIWSNMRWWDLPRSWNLIWLGRGPNINHRLSHAGLDTQWQMTVVWSKIQYHFQIFAALPYSIFVNLVGNLYWGIQKSGKVDRRGKLNSHSRTKDKWAKTCATFVYGCKFSWPQGKKKLCNST